MSLNYIGDLSGCTKIKRSVTIFRSHKFFWLALTICFCYLLGPIHRYWPKSSEKSSQLLNFWLRALCKTCYNSRRNCPIDKKRELRTPTKTFNDAVMTGAFWILILYGNYIKAQISFLEPLERNRNQESQPYSCAVVTIGMIN